MYNLTLFARRRPNVFIIRIVEAQQLVFTGAFKATVERFWGCTSVVGDSASVTSSRRAVRLQFRERLLALAGRR